MECSSDLELLHSGRAFVIAVDPTRLAPGLHYTSIKGIPFPTICPSKVHLIFLSIRIYDIHHGRVLQRFLQRWCVFATYSSLATGHSLPMIYIEAILLKSLGNIYPRLGFALTAPCQ